VEPSEARRAWHLIETVNAVSYFTEECREAATRLGLKGFWMGYFANRASPMGAVPASVVEATFYNFHPAMVRRAIPDAWSFAPVGEVLGARSEAAARAIRARASEAQALAPRLVALLRPLIEAADGAGRPLFSANRDVEVTGDVERLWQALTTLREHRGDGHVAVLTEAGLDGCEVHLVAVAASGQDPSTYQAARGWSVDDWAHAAERLRERGLLDAAERLTTEGRELRERIERRTDELAIRPYRSLSEAAFGELLSLLGTLARQIAAAGAISYPNPMGLPKLEDERSGGAGPSSG